MPGRFLTVARLGSMGLFKFIRRYWYWIIFLIVTIPILYDTLKTSLHTGNPLYPLIKLGLHLVDADKVLYETVEVLKSNPVDLIGMVKPTSGIWNSLVYYWFFFKNVIWKIFGLLWLITFPFVMVYKIVRTGQTSEPAKNSIKTIFYGGLLMFVVNVLVALYYSMKGELLTYKFPEGASVEYNTWILILVLLPFHGVVNLIIYLFSLI